MAFSESKKMMNHQFKILVTFKPAAIEIKKKYLKIFKNKKIKIIEKFSSQSLSAKQLLKIIHKFDGIICGDDEINDLVLSKAKKLKIISKWGTGIDSIDLTSAKRRGIVVCNTPNAFTNSVANLAIGMIFSLYRNIQEIHNDIHLKRWPKVNGKVVQNKTLGIIGLGNIGKKVAQMCCGFDMKIFGTDIKKINLNFLKRSHVRMISKKNLLKICDIIILCTDLNKTSYKLLDNKDFKLMKKKPIIINISRGPVINEKALIKALDSKKISGAGLDVFEKEPLNYSSKLRKFKNCILSSHNAFNTFEEVNYVHKNTIQNLFNHLV
jgi:D-3-phosphoglycerate dehydrogenase